MRTIRIAGLIGLIASNSAAFATSRSSVEAACDASLVIAAQSVEQNQPRRLVFDPEDAPSADQLRGLRWRSGTDEHPRAAPPPPLSLVRTLEKQGDLNAVPRCKNVRSFLSNASVEFGSAAVNAALMTEKNFTYQATIMHVSLAVLSAYGRNALVKSSATSAPLAAAGWLFLLERDHKGKWSVVRRALIWIS